VQIPFLAVICQGPVATNLHRYVSARYAEYESPESVAAASRELGRRGHAAPNAGQCIVFLNQGPPRDFRRCAVSTNSIIPGSDLNQAILWRINVRQPAALQQLAKCNASFERQRFRPPGRGYDGLLGNIGQVQKLG